MKITAYHIEYADGIHKLKARVNEKIADGWQPTGGVATTVDEDGESYYQAMVRDES